MRIFLICLILFHSAIHLMGFMKAFSPESVKSLESSISKNMGLIWLLTFLIFLITIALLMSNYRYWWMMGILATVISQILIVTLWQEAKYGTIVNVIFFIVCMVSGLAYNYYSQYQKDVFSSITSSLPLNEELLLEKDIEHLPVIVQKYIKYAGCLGKPKVNNFKVKFKGKIRKNEEEEWMSFSSEQYNFISKPTRLFFMNATMKHLPVAGYHKYTESKASMDIRLFSCINVQFQQGPEMDVAETVTFFNDMCCMAPATLIDARITWQEVSELKVKSTFTHKDIIITADLFFNQEGQLINFISNQRFDANAGKPLPWETPLKNYKSFDGYHIAGYAETIYQYPDKKLKYGEFQTLAVEYNVHTVE